MRLAHDGTEAVRICDDWLPTHVLMDIGMPGMDGFEAARRSAGIDEHLVKPVRVLELKAVLSR